MSARIVIRPAQPGDTGILLSFHPELMHDHGLAERVLDGCVLIAFLEGRPCGTLQLNLKQRELYRMKIHRDAEPMEIGPKLVEQAERRAIQFGLTALDVRFQRCYLGLIRHCGYIESKAVEKPGSTRADDIAVAHRSIRRRQTRYGRRIANLMAEIGISRDYGSRHRIPLQYETANLASIGNDIYGREQQLEPEAARSWLRMAAAASGERIELQPVSGFRSVDYQAGILRRKLERGQELGDILKVSAAPGYSEHHTGRALDITTPGYRVLEEEFEMSPAFKWLSRQAAEFGFRMSFPRQNRHSVGYEPWHWAFIESQ